MQTAILLRVPEAEPLVYEWRQQGDPSAAHGVPAHVTLLYPFLPSASIDEGVLAELGWFFRGIDAFPVHFTQVRRFEDAGVVWIEPASDTLVQLTRALARRWPECPPYDGEIPIDDVLPHLTIVQTENGALRHAAEVAVGPGLPFEILVASAALWTEDDDGAWSERATFPFGPAE
jgi:hypothetical protein